MVMQDRVQLTAQLLIGWIRTSAGQQVAQAEETAYQRSSSGSQKAKSLAGLGASNHRLGLVLQDHRLCGDATHRSARLNSWIGVA
jgi:hypothetical protein